MASGHEKRWHVGVHEQKKMDVSVIGESAQEILQKRMAQAEQNRRAMPTVTAWVDQTRERFPNARVTFAQEGGKTVGKPSPQGVVPVLAPRSRQDDPTTSKSAAAGAATFSARHEALIFNAIYEAGERGATAKEIAAAIGLTDVQVNRRLSAMAERGLIRRSGEVMGGCAVWIKS